MEKLQNVILIFLILLLAVLGGLFVLGWQKPAEGSIFVESTKPARVLINSQVVGNAPYLGKSKFDSALVRLETLEGGLVYETSVKVVPSMTSLVRIKFGDTFEETSGEVTYFEKIRSEEIELSLVSMPDSAQVRIDGQVKGFTPFKTSVVPAGQHKITVSMNGFIEEEFEVLTQEGYRVVSIVRLAKKTASVAEEIEVKIPTKTMVEILPTPTGFLRVRKEANKSTEEMGQAKPGEKYDLLEQTDGWYKIAFGEGEGWISSDYAKVIEEPQTP